MPDPSDCTACPLHQHRQQVVPGQGNPHASIMLVGEGPGAEEDRRGLPFIGPAGQRLNGILDRAPLCRQDVYLDNVLKCRPPANDIRSCPQAILLCPRLWLDPMIETINPRVLVALGATSGNRWFPGCDAGQMSELQRTLPSGRLVVGSFHPSHALRSGGPWNKIDDSIVASLRRAVSLADGGTQ
jgi:DNA polymerase